MPTSFTPTSSFTGRPSAQTSSQTSQTPTQSSSRFSCLLQAALCIALSAASFGQAALAQEPTWKSVDVPGVWKRPPGEISREGKGFAWYRCRVKLPADWSNRSVTLYVESADDARVFFINGAQVGSFGAFPPRFRTGLGAENRFPVPAAALKDAGEFFHVAIRVYQKEARANFNVAAPVLFAGDQAIVMRGAWEVHFGDLEASQAGQATTEAISKVVSSQEAEKSLKQIEGDNGPLSVPETLARLETFDDLAIDCPLAEPHIGQPLQIKFDHRGRMWVVNYKQYPKPAGLKMLSRDKYLRSVYDQLPEPPPNHFPGADQITIHEDVDGDGDYDRHKVFVEGLSLCTSLAIGRGGVFVLNPPYLLFYPDRNRDDIPDGDPEVLLEGFHLEDSHSVCNSLRWGPDGWLYAGQGSTVTGSVKRYGSKDEPVHSMGQLIWRYHPETRQYEVFAEGGGNTFGVEVDAQGRVYSGHNGGDTRGFHYVQGGYYRKGFGKHGELSNPHAYGYFPHMTHHSVPRFTHNFVIYEGDHLPAKYHGKLFGVGPLQGHVVMSEVTTRGSTFQTKDAGHPLKSSDTWVRPVEIRSGPDGAIYVADFYEQRIDHASHYQGRVTPESGRIYRIRAKEGELRKPEDLSLRSSRDLLTLLEHPNKWHRQQALRLLADRRDPSIVESVRERIEATKGQAALELLWALNLSGGLDDSTAAKLLQHPEHQVRLWTVRLICDDGVVSDDLAQRMASLAATEPHVEARCQLACSARRLPAAQSLEISRGLIGHNEDADDPFIPLLIWWNIEKQAGADRDAVVQFFGEESMWRWTISRDHLIQRMARRFAATSQRQDLLACATLLERAPDDDAVAAVMKGIDEAFAGRVVRGLPTRLLEAMANRGKASLPFRIRQGDRQAYAEAIKQVTDGATPLADRLLLTEVFGQTPQPSFLPVLLKLAEGAGEGEGEGAGNDTLRAMAFNSLQAYDDSAIGALAIKLHKQLSKDVREVAQSLLTSRPDWSRQYVAAVQGGQVAAKDVPLPVVRRMLLHQDKAIDAAVQQLWGDVQGATSEQMLEQIKLYKQWIGQGSGNPYDGKRLFQNNCGKCHQLFASGGKIGPDLTAYKRDDLHSMLLNVVNPSLEIREGYESYMLLTEDGLRLTGFD